MKRVEICEICVGDARVVYYCVYVECEEGHQEFKHELDEAFYGQIHLNLIEKVETLTKTMKNDGKMLFIAQNQLSADGTASYSTLLEGLYRL